MITASELVLIIDRHRDVAEAAWPGFVRAWCTKVSVGDVLVIDAVGKGDDKLCTEMGVSPPMLPAAANHFAVTAIMLHEIDVAADSDGVEAFGPGLSSGNYSGPDAVFRAVVACLDKLKAMQQTKAVQRGYFVPKSVADAGPEAMREYCKTVPLLERDGDTVKEATP